MEISDDIFRVASLKGMRIIYILTYWSDRGSVERSEETDLSCPESGSSESLVLEENIKKNLIGKTIVI